MPRPANNHPTDGEMEILKVLWSSGPSSLGNVRKGLLEKKDVALTTVATMLKVMSEKGWVKREGSGRSARWLAAVTQRSVGKGLVRKLVDHAFEGSANRLATHLIEGGQISQTELAELRKLIDAQEKKTPCRKSGKRGK